MVRMAGTRNSERTLVKNNIARKYNFSDLGVGLYVRGYYYKEQ
jgi:hypothetical protein